MGGEGLLGLPVSEANVKSLPHVDLSWHKAE